MSLSFFFFLCSSPNSKAFISMHKGLLIANACNSQPKDFFYYQKSVLSPCAKNSGRAMVLKFLNQWWTGIN
jgi:hypothetical protein